MSDFIEWRVGNYDCASGYLFSTDIMSTMDKYHNDAADRLIEKAKNMCKDHVNDVSAKGFACLHTYPGYNCLFKL